MPIATALPEPTSDTQPQAKTQVLFRKIECSITHFSKAASQKVMPGKLVYLVSQNSLAKANEPPFKAWYTREKSKLLHP